MSQRSVIRVIGPKLAITGMVVTGALTGLALLQVFRSVTDPANTSAPGYVSLAYAAGAVLLAVFVIAAFVRRADIGLAARFPLLIGAVSFAVSFLPWWAIAHGPADLGAAIYRGLRVPQGIIQFWDLTLVMKSVDCDSWGFDVYAPNNGCLQDPSIYAPGVAWLQHVPFSIFSEANVAVLGVVSMAISSLFLVWLARMTAGIGQLVILVAAVGGPWLLLLERGNLDAAAMWAAGAVVLLVRRWDRLWAWSLGAAIIWVIGTWKYYPFAMGLMLIPALRLRRGWTVIAGYAIATGAFMLATWDNFAFSSQSNSNMTDYGDFVVLGRVPVVARMIGTVVGASGLQAGDVLLFALALVAAGWGVAIGLTRASRAVHPAMLAMAGSTLFLSSVLVAGFGWGYKASFLLLALPLVAALTRSREAVVVSSAVAVVALTGVSSVVVWNTVLATLAGLIVASFAFGLAGIVLLRSIRTARPTTA